MGLLSHESHMSGSSIVEIITDWLNLVTSSRSMTGGGRMTVALRGFPILVRNLLMGL